MTDDDIRPGAGKSALVTGASAGIGAAFARLLAQEGFDIVLTARREDRLSELAERLRSTCGVRVETVSADLAEPDAVDRIVAATETAKCPVDFLVNNAGYAVTGRFDEADWSEHARFMQVMATAPAELAHKLLPGMRRRGWGRIVNVASLAGIMPGTAGHTLYAPVKAFLIKLSEALQFEGEKDDVRSLALCPGFTYTEFHDVSGVRDQVSELPEWMWMSAEEVVAQGYAAAMKGTRPVLVTGLPNKALAGVARVLPDPVVHGLTRRLMKKARAQSRTDPGAGYAPTPQTESEAVETAAAETPPSPAQTSPAQTETPAKRAASTRTPRATTTARKTPAKTTAESKPASTRTKSAGARSKSEKAAPTEAGRSVDPSTDT